MNPTIKLKPNELEVRGTLRDAHLGLAELACSLSASFLPKLVVAAAGIGLLTWSFGPQVNLNFVGLMAGMLLLLLGVRQFGRRSDAKWAGALEEARALVRSVNAPLDAPTSLRVELAPLPTIADRPSGDGTRRRTVISLETQTAQGQRLSLWLHDVLQTTSRRTSLGSRTYRITTEWRSHSASGVALSFSPGSAPLVEALGPSAAVFFGPAVGLKRSVTIKEGVLRVEAEHTQSPGLPWLASTANDCGAILSDAPPLLDPARAERLSRWEADVAPAVKRRFERRGLGDAAACALLAIALSAGGRTWAIDQSIAWRSQPWINGPSSEAAWGLRRAQSDLATAEAALPAAQQADREAAQRHAEATPAAADEVPEEGRRHRRRRRHRRDEVPQVPSPPTPTAPSIAERIRELRGSTIPGYEAEVARQRSREAAYRASFDRETEEREREEALSLAAAIAAAVASVAALVLGRRSPPIPPPANALL